MGAPQLGSLQTEAQAASAGRRSPGVCHMAVWGEVLGNEGSPRETKEVLGTTKEVLGTPRESLGITRNCNYPHQDSYDPYQDSAIIYEDFALDFDLDFDWIWL